MSSKLTYTLSDLKKIVEAHLLLNDYTIVDIIVATIIGNLFPTDPLWLQIIGAPSSGKTELLNAIEDFPKVFSISDFTTSTLISGKKDSSLLSHLDGKIIVMKDFTTILSKRHDDLKIIMSQLREVYDGKFSKGFGTGEHQKWSGHVGFIGGCTDAYDRHYGVIGQMGERFLLYRIENQDNLDAGLQALCGFGCENKMRKEIKTAFTKFLSQFKKVDITIPKPPEDLLYKITSLAKFSGHGRCPVHRDRYTKEITYRAVPEGEARLSKQLYHMAISLMTIRREKSVNDKIYEIVKKIGSDLIPRFRFIVLRYLYEKRATEIHVYWITTGDIAEGVNVHGRTTLRALQDLSIIGFIKGRLAATEQGKPYEWQLTEKALKLIGGSEIFQDLDS